MKKVFHRLTGILCLFTALVLFVFPLQSTAKYESRPWASEYAYTLNSLMLEKGVISSDACGDYLDITSSGIIYADLIYFDSEDAPCLLAVSAGKGSVTAEVYKYKKGDAEKIAEVSRNIDDNSADIGVISIGETLGRSYMAYCRYNGDSRGLGEYYTVIDGEAFERVNTPDDAPLSGIVSFGEGYIHPEVDVSCYNKYLTEFFSSLKDMSAMSVTEPSIAEDITDAEKDRLSKVLKKTAEFASFDIGEYSSMSEYSMAVTDRPGQAEFNAITHVYDLGSEMYYIRYSTDRSFYNGAILRRTDMLSDKYQILAVRSDFIPFSDTELASLKEAYDKNRLVLEKSSSSMERKSEPVIKVKKFNIKKVIDVEQVLPPSSRPWAAIVGGGVCLALFIALWAIMSKHDDE